MMYVHFDSVLEATLMDVTKCSQVETATHLHKTIHKLGTVIIGL